jgi:hypothetical protein
MAQKISVQIALEGGAELQRQLAAIGDQGEAAFKQIDRAAQQVGGFRNLNTEAVEQSLKKVGITGVASINSIQQAVKEAGRLEELAQGVAKLEVGANKVTAAFGLTRREINGVRAALRQIDLGPLGSQLGALARVGAAFKGPGVAIAAIAGGLAAATKVTINFAQSIAKAADEAAKLGISFQQFDKLRATMEAAGVPAEGISKAIENIAKATEQADLDKVTNAIKDLQDAATRGFGAQGTEQLKTLEEAAKGIGPAADKARDALKEMGIAPARSLKELVDQLGKLQGLTAFLGQVQAGGATASLKEFIAAFGQTQGFQAFLQQLAAMPNEVQRNKLAMDQLGISADTLNKVLERMRSGQPLTGLISPDDVAKANELTGAIERLKASWDRLGSVGLAPTLTVGLDVATAAVQRLNEQLQQNPWTTWLSGAQAVANPLQFLAQQAINLAARLLGLAPAADQANQALQQTGQAGAQAGQAGAQGFKDWEQVLASVKIKNEEIAPATTQAGQAGAQAGETAASGWNGYLAKLNEILLKLGRILSGGGSGTTASGGATGSFASGGLLGGRGSSGFAAGGRGRISGTSVSSFADQIPGFAAGGLAGGGNQLWQFLDNITTQLDNALGALNPNLVNSVLQIAKMVETPMQALLGFMDTISRNARGGLLGGRGTGRSDSNLAWVSRGEYITPAAAVAQPGVLEFLELLRRSGGNLRSVLHGMGRFALGGMVPRSMPAFASGGLAGGSNVTIQFPGLPPIGGLRASSDVVDQLHRAAALAQVRSGGRKPSRYS